MSVTDRPLDSPVQPDGTVTPSDADFFQSAMADPPSPPPAEPASQEPSPPPAEPSAQPASEAVTQPRDEHGRFAPRTPPAPEQATQAPAAATQQQPESDGAVPSWRLRDEREQREAAANRARQLETELADMRQRHAVMERQFREQQQQPVQVPDMIADPAAYHAYVEQTFNERLRNMEANFSFRIAHSSHGETFEKAYSDMIALAERGNPSIVRAVMASPDPGSALMNWYQREQTLQKVGSDPDAWFDKELEQRLKDPKFAAKVERLRGGGQQPVPGQQSGVRTEFQLPPSLNRVAASAGNTETAGDLSDTSLFQHAFRQR